MSDKILPRIPLEVFKKMVHTISLDDLRQLPPAKLPREIPQDILRGIEGERREILDELLFEANSHHVSERLALEQVFGSELIPALDRVKTQADGIVSPAFVAEVERLETLVEDQVNRPNNKTEDLIQAHIAEMRPSIVDANSERQKLNEHCEMLRKGFHLSGQYQPDFKEAIAAIREQLHVLDHWLSRFNQARLRIVSREIDHKTREVVEKSRRLNDIYFEIEEINKRIKTSSEAMGLHGDKINQNHFIQELRNELQLMDSLKPQYDIIIPEEDLTQWMDVVIDAYVTDLGDETLEKAMKAAQESLFTLLKRYCEAQNDAAQQVATREFTTLDRDANMRYMLETERFVLKYFKHKEVDIKGWGVDQDTLARLEKFEAMVLDVIRENTA
ncbi:MAG: hypothetical protein ACQES2_02640 [Pseudomonadota bacterium]